LVLVLAIVWFSTFTFSLKPNFASVLHEKNKIKLMNRKVLIFFIENKLLSKVGIKISTENFIYQMRIDVIDEKHIKLIKK
jgi:hypothetical protein